MRINQPELGKKLRYLRRHKDVTQFEMGSVLGITKAYISYYENGHTTPTLSRISQICDYLNVDPDTLEPKE